MDEILHMEIIDAHVHALPRGCAERKKGDLKEIQLVEIEFNSQTKTLYNMT